MTVQIGEQGEKQTDKFEYGFPIPFVFPIKGNCVRVSLEKYVVVSGMSTEPLTGLDELKRLQSGFAGILRTDLMDGSDKIGFGKEQYALNGRVLLYNGLQSRTVFLAKTAAHLSVLGGVRESFCDPQAGHT